MPKIKIDKEKCIGCGTCAVIAPDHFEIGEDGKAQAKKEAEENEMEAIKSAVDGCPVQAISLE